MLAPERGPRWQIHAQPRNLRISVDDRRRKSAEGATHSPASARSLCTAAAVITIRKRFKSTMKIKTRTSCTRPRIAGRPGLPRVPALAPALALSPLKANCASAKIGGDCSGGRLWCSSRFTGARRAGPGACLRGPRTPGWNVLRPAARHRGRAGSCEQS